jgi:DNA polymerase phi
MSTTLPLFWNLSSASKKERVGATVKLVSSLEHFQAQFVPNSGQNEAAEEDSDASDLEVDDDGRDALNTLNSQDVAYSLRRLCRGLASPRESSRLGFAVALTEVRIIRIILIECNTYLFSSFWPALTQYHARRC